MSRDNEESPTPDFFKESLSFYGVQLQSKGAIILGLALLIFAIIQAWGQLVTAGKVASYDAPIFSFVVGAIGSGIVYELWRLYYYGKLASSLLYSSEKGFSWAKEEWNKKAKEVHDIAKWEHLFSPFKVSYFSEAVVWRTTNRLWIKLRILKDLDQHIRLSAWVLVLAFELLFAFSYVLVFGTADWFVLGFELISIVFLLFAYYFGWKRIMQPRLKRDQPTQWSS